MIGSMKYYEAKVSKEFENNQVDWRGVIVNLINTNDQKKQLKKFSEKHQTNMQNITNPNNFNLVSYFIQIQPT